MSVQYDCKNYTGDGDECHKCKVSGYIFACPDYCSEYTDHFGKQPYKNNTEIEKYLKGETFLP